MRDLKGRVAVVTGGASGIGRAMAARFAREGMRVVVADIEEKALAHAREELAAGGAEVLAVRTDVSRWEDVDALAARTVEKFGAVHVVCNNAGIGSGGPCWALSLADWQWTLGVNLWGVIHGIRAFVPRLIAQGEGHVVNTASIAGLLTPPMMGPYCASKHAVVAISECLQQDLRLAAGGAKVNVSVVCPAWVKTNIADAERNRPAALRGPAREPSPQAQMMAEMIRSAIAGGIPPENVAEAVLRAVLEERFYVLTHEDTKKAVERRFQGVLEGNLPPFDPTKM